MVTIVASSTTINWATLSKARTAHRFGSAVAGLPAGALTAAIARWYRAVGCGPVSWRSHRDHRDLRTRASRGSYVGWMADRRDADFTYSLTDRIIRLSLGELPDFSGAKFDGDFALGLEQAQRRKH